MTKIKRNDSGIVIPYTLPEEYRNLDGASVEFLLENKRSTALVAKGEAVIVDPAAGHLAYTLAEGETLGAGIHIGEFQVTYADGTFISFPRSGYLEVDIQRNIDGGRALESEERIAVKVSLIDEKFDAMEAKNAVFKGEVGAQVAAIENETAEWRSAVADDVLADVYEQVDVDRVSNTEVREARGGEATLGAKMAKVDSQLAQKANESEVFLKSTGININDLDESTRKVFLESQGIDVNYVLGDRNVKPINTSFMNVSPNIIDPSKRRNGFTLGFAWNSDTPESYIESSNVSSYEKTLATTPGEVVYSNVPGRLIWYGTNNLVGGNATFAFDSDLGLYKVTVGGGVQSKVTGVLSDINSKGFWFVCKSNQFGGSISTFGSIVLNDNIESNVFAKKAEIQVELNSVKSDISKLKQAATGAMFFMPRYLYCFTNDISRKWIPKFNVMVARNDQDFFLDITAPFGVLKDKDRVKTQASDTVSVKVARTNEVVYSKRYDRRSVDPSTKANPTTPKNVLVIGDSFSDAGFIPCDLKDQLVNKFGFNNFNFIGTKSDTIKGVTALNEGRGGYTIDDFTKTTNTSGRGTTFSNPFLSNGTVSFSNYMSRNSFSGDIDFVFIELGINNSIVFSDSPEIIRGKMKTLVDLILVSYPNCRIFITGLVPISNINGQYEASHHNGLVLRINEQFESFSLQTEYASKCVYVDTGVFFDSNYGYPYEMRSYRGSDEAYKVVTDWNHPNEAGYYMMTDSLTSAFVYHM